MNSPIIQQTNWLVGLDTLCREGEISFLASFPFVPLTSLHSFKVEKIMTDRFTASDLQFRTMSGCSAAELGLLALYVTTQYPRDGKKHPERSLEWLFHHGLPHLRPKEHEYSPPHQIYFALNASKHIVDVAGVVPDDRGVAKQLGLFESDPHYFGFFGGHRVHPDLRGQGIGTLMVRHRMEQLLTFVNDVRRKPASLYAFLINEISGRRLAAVGFENLGLRYIEDSQGKEYIYRRLISPGETL
jgi:GNAT superfamily N-acetyltransferase